MTATGPGQERSSLILDCHGAQNVRARFATGGGFGDKPYVVVSSPSTMVYAYEPQTVAAVTYTFLLAKIQAGRALPAEHDQAQHQVARRVTSSITLANSHAVLEPRTVDARHSPDGSAHVVVRLDGLTMRLYDRASLDTYARGWLDAYDSCDLAFGRSPGLSPEALLERATRQARSPFQLDSLEGATQLLSGRAPRAQLTRSSEVHEHQRGT